MSASKTNYQPRELTPCSFKYLPHLIDEQTHDALQASVEKKILVEMGREIFHAMSESRYLYIIQKGVVKISILLTDGREQVSGFYIEGEMFGFDGLAVKKHQSDALALTDVELCVIPISIFYESKTPDLTAERFLLDQFVKSIMCREIRRDQRIIAMLGALHAEEKVIAFLLNFSYRQMLRQHSAEVLDMPMSRSDIGSFLGITPETVSRTLSKLQREALIHLEGHEIILNDLAQLKKRVDSNFS